MTTDTQEDPAGDHDHTHDEHDHGHDHDHAHDHDHDHDHAPVEHEASSEKVGARVSMKITVAADELSTAVEDVAKMYRQRAKIEGFRRGKAPMPMIRQRFADEIKEHVLDQIIPLHVGHEIKQQGFKPIQNPILENVEYAPGSPLVIQVHFDVDPEVEVTGYQDLKATKTTKKVSEEQVEKAIENMREQSAKLDALDDDATVEPGDYVVVNIELFPRDGKGKKLAEDERFVHVGEERAIPALNDQLVGQTKGSSREFVAELGANYPNDLLAGKEVQCKVHVQDIKRRVLPAVDDDLAKDLGFEDLEELRKKMRENYADHMEEEAERDVARQLMDQVIAANPVDTPESLVESRLDHSMQRAAEDLARQGVDPRNSVDWANYRAENKPFAERAVSEEILLDGIAVAESIEISDDDVMAEIESHQEGQPEGAAARIAQQMRQDGSFDGLRRAMIRRRALDWIKSHATIDSVEAEAEPAE